MQTEAALSKTRKAIREQSASIDFFGMAVVGAVLFAVYFFTFEWMYSAWNAVDSNYSHGYWVPLVIGYFFWENKDSLRALPKHQDASGMWFIAAALGVHLLAALLDVNFLSGLTLIPLMLGLAYYYFGYYVYKVAIWPMLFIVFMVPLPWIQAALTIRFQFYSAAMATHLFNLMGFSTSRYGTILEMPHFRLFVEAPCSGLNTLISLMFVGSVVAYLARGIWWRKVLLLASAIPIAVAANICRIVIIGLLGEFYGEDVAMGIFHNWSGIMMYAIALTLFLLEAWVLRVKFTGAGEVA